MTVAAGSVVQLVREILYEGQVVRVGTELLVRQVHRADDDEYLVSPLQRPLERFWVRWDEVQERT